MAATDALNAFRRDLYNECMTYQVEAEGMEVDLWVAAQRVALATKANIAALKSQLVEQSVVSTNLTRENHVHSLVNDPLEPQLMHGSLFGESHGIRSGLLDELQL